MKSSYKLKCSVLFYMNMNNKKVQKKMLLSKSFHLKATTNSFHLFMTP